VAQLHTFLAKRDPATTRSAHTETSRSATRLGNSEVIA
jgi:hypothetical protein